MQPNAKATRPGWDGGRHAWMRGLLAGELGGGLYRRRSPTIEPVFAQIKFNRKIDASSDEAAPRHARNGD